MNIAQMLLDSSEKKEYIKPKHRRPGAPGGAENPMHKKAVTRYRDLLLNQVLSTPQLASKLGSSWSSNIIKTLYRLETLGLVKHVGYLDREHGGRAAKTWTWIGK